MARHKKDTPEGKLESERWRETMKRIYGGDKGVSEYFRELGMRGGKAPCKRPKGFASNPEFARKCGKKGGSISRRVYEKYSKWDSIKEEAYNLYKSGVPMTKIAGKYDLSVSGIRLKLKKMEEHEA